MRFMQRIDTILSALEQPPEKPIVEARLSNITCSDIPYLVPARDTDGHRIMQQKIASMEHLRQVSILHTISGARVESHQHALQKFRTHVRDLIARLNPGEIRKFTTLVLVGKSSTSADVRRTFAFLQPGGGILIPSATVLRKGIEAARDQNIDFDASVW